MPSCSRNRQLGMALQEIEAVEDEIYPVIFQGTASSADSWRLFARRLKFAGDRLFADYKKHWDDHAKTGGPVNALEQSLIITSTLLIGLAFENLLKAILITQGHCTVEGLKLTRWPGGGHNQPCLAAAAKLSPSPQELSLLERLTAYVEWAGRYPVPLAAERMAMKEDVGFGRLPPEPIQFREKSIVDEYFDRLLSEVKIEST